MARVVAAWEAAGAQTRSQAGRARLRRFLEALDALAEAADQLAAEANARLPDRSASNRLILVAGSSPRLKELRRALGSQYRLGIVATREPGAGLAEARGTEGVVAFGGPGVEVLRKLRQLHPLLPAVAVVSEDAIPRLVEEFADDPVILLRDTARPEQVAAAARALLGAPARSRAAAAPDWPPALDPRSYAHLAGLLPRALERTIDFDVGASVIVRPDLEPVVDVHCRADLDEGMLRELRDSVMALFLVAAGGALGAHGAVARFPAAVRSSLYVPLATESRVVGLTWLGAFREGAFSAEDERILASLATHASAAYRSVESSVSRLRLTPRQTQVLALIASGLPDKDVAKRLGLAHRTVRTHLDRLLREHGFHSRTEAAAAWLRGQTTAGGSAGQT